MVKASISCALRREGLQSILNSIGWHLSPIKEDTESWACASKVREKCSRVSYAGNITGWCWKDIIGLRVDLYPQQLCGLMQSPSRGGIQIAQVLPV